MNEDPEDELAELALECWPAGWPGQKLVEFDCVGDATEWLDQRVVGAELDTLTEGEIADDSPLAESLAYDYLVALAENSFEMPWAFGDDPTDPEWIEECREEIRLEFVAFLRKWRENVRHRIAQRKT
jgi:hypothetical protein